MAEHFSTAPRSSHHLLGWESSSSVPAPASYSHQVSPAAKTPGPPVSAGQSSATVRWWFSPTTALCLSPPPRLFRCAPCGCRLLSNTGLFGAGAQWLRALLSGGHSLAVPQAPPPPCLPAVVLSSYSEGPHISHLPAVTSRLKHCPPQEAFPRFP